MKYILIAVLMHCNSAGFSCSPAYFPLNFQEFNAIEECIFAKEQLKQLTDDISYQWRGFCAPKGMPK